jgi:hypothetical protein
MPGVRPSGNDQAASDRSATAPWERLVDAVVDRVSHAR